MLAQILAIAVAVGSALLFITAFVFPKLHRQDDFFWGAVGLFYALVLWVCAGQMVGAILLGQLASVILLGWLAWEMLRLRQAIADPSKIPDLDQVSLVGYVKARFNQPKPAKPAKAKPEKSQPETTPETAIAEVPVESPEVVTPEADVPVVENPVSETPVTPSEPVATPEVVEPVSEASESVAPETEPETPTETTTETNTEVAIAPEPVTTEEPATATTPEVTEPKKGFSLGRLFSRKETAIASPDTATETLADDDIDAIFDDEPEPETTTDEAIAPSDTNPEKPQQSE